MKRKTIWLSLFTGLAASISVAFFIGAGIPVIIYQGNTVGFMMVGMGILLSIIFVAIAMLAAVRTRDKAKGIGVAILLWLYFALLFDGLILFLLFQFADYPLEKPMIGVTILNPVDLGRILILLQMDVSAMMGYTGAVFLKFFNGAEGIAITTAALALWVSAPIALGMRAFQRKDF